MLLVWDAIGPTLGECVILFYTDFQLPIYTGSGLKVCVGVVGGGGGGCVKQF